MIVIVIVAPAVVIAALGDLLQQVRTDAADLTQLSHRLVGVVLLDNFLVVLGMLDFDVLV